MDRLGSRRGRSAGFVGFTVPEIVRPVAWSCTACHNKLHWTLPRFAQSPNLRHTSTVEFEPELSLRRNCCWNYRCQPHLLSRWPPTATTPIPVLFVDALSSSPWKSHLIEKPTLEPFPTISPQSNGPRLPGCGE